MIVKAISASLYAIACAVLLDLIFLGWAMTAIASGEEVLHIPFWDAQIKLLASLLN